MKRVSFLILVIALLGIAGTAAAQSAASTGDNTVYFASHFSNNVAAAPDATARFVDDGDTAGDL